MGAGENTSLPLIPAIQHQIQPMTHQLISVSRSGNLKHGHPQPQNGQFYKDTLNTKVGWHMVYKPNLLKGNILSGTSIPLCPFLVLLVALGQLNFRKLKSLALSGVRLGLDGTILNLQRFLERIDLSFGLLVNTGEGELGKSVKSLKSLNIILHLLLRISWTVG